MIRHAPRQRHRPRAGPASPVNPSAIIASMNPLNSAVSPASRGVPTCFAQSVREAEVRPRPGATGWSLV